VSSIVKSFTPHTAQGDTGSDAVHARVSEYEVFASDPDAPVQSRPEVQQTTEFSADFPLENTRPVEKIKEPGGGPAELAIVMPDSVDTDRASTDMSETHCRPVRHRYPMRTPWRRPPAAIHLWNCP
jgi:hypothetical protein